MATHSNILAGKLPETEEPGRLQSMGCKESVMTEHVCLMFGQEDDKMCSSVNKK